MFAVPFCFARHGLLSKSVSEDDITALYIAAVKRSVDPFQAAQLDAAIAHNRAGFALNRASFGNALNAYYDPSHGITREILHVVFFVPRSAPTDVIEDDIRARVNTIHAMWP